MKKKQAFEVNFDGLVGPTHNYGGLSYGNVASLKNQFISSNPRQAALQGLEKMKFLLDKGIKQAVLPPQQRPFTPFLRAIGFSGSDNDILKTVSHQFPDLLLAISSSASMWSANAATISPSIDSVDNCLHLLPANLTSMLHRSIEVKETAKIFKIIFNNQKYFIPHDPLPGGLYFADEGAANHHRFCRSYHERGVHLFVFGGSAFDVKEMLKPKKFPSRQTLEASLATARLFQLDSQQTVFAQQHPDAIDAGAFHNDVVSLGNKNVFLFHENAFVDKDKVIKEIESKVASTCQTQIIFLEIKAKDLSLKDAISSYLFNSQLISMNEESMELIAPIECEENPITKNIIDSLIQSKDNPIHSVHYLDLKQSMQNGGGPACLRLRVLLSPEEMKAAKQEVFLTNTLYQTLKTWINTHYRDHLTLKDLADPLFLDETYIALDELTKLLNLGMLYPFQR